MSNKRLRFINDKNIVMNLFKAILDTVARCSPFMSEIDNPKIVTIKVNEETIIVISEMMFEYIKSSHQSPINYNINIKNLFIKEPYRPLVIFEIDNSLKDYSYSI